jgi:hypothetical protein
LGLHFWIIECCLRFDFDFNFIRRIKPFFRGYIRRKKKRKKEKKKKKKRKKGVI